MIEKTTFEPTYLICPVIWEKYWRWEHLIFCLHTITRNAQIFIILFLSFKI